MISTFRHQSHSDSWLFPSPGERNNFQCLACLLEILQDFSISRVQREVALGLFKSMVELEERLLIALSSNVSLCLDLIKLLVGSYAKEPFKKAATSLCSSLIHKVQDELLFQVMIDQMDEIVHRDAQSEELHFCLAVFNELCEKSFDNARVLYRSDDMVLENIIKCRDDMDQTAVTELATLLKYVVKGMLGVMPIHAHSSNTLLQEVIEALLTWLEVNTNKSLYVPCIALLSECVESPVLSAVMLARRDAGSSMLLMGLKRLLATKDETTILRVTQCLTKLIDNSLEPIHVKIILDTDMAELVFEFLHSSNAQILSCALQCLQTMAEHEMFFDKCHAVYGMETTLSAIQVAVDTKKSAVLEKALAFLTCLLDRQPEMMPLFLNQTWEICGKLLRDVLQSAGPDMISSVLCAIEAFLRPRHQQNPLGVRVIINLVRDINSSSKNKLSQSRQQILTPVLKSLFAIADSLHKLLLLDNIQSGNEDTDLDELKHTIDSFCMDFLLPFVIDSWHDLQDTLAVQGLFVLLDIITSQLVTCNDKLMQVLPMELLHQGLILLFQSFVSENTQSLGIHVVITVLERYAATIKPQLQVNLHSLVGGFSKLQWNLSTSMDRLSDMMRDRDSMRAAFLFLYFSLLQGYSIFDGDCLLQFLKSSLWICNNHVINDDVVVRSFIYILAVCQANMEQSIDDVLFEGNEENFIVELEKLPVESWFTAGPAVFSWALSSKHKRTAIGKPMVEYWLLHLDYSLDQQSFQMTFFSAHDQAIISAIICHNNFLQCLLDLIQSHVQEKSKDILFFCINELSDVNAWATGSLVLSSLKETAVQLLDSLLLQCKDSDSDAVLTLLEILCKISTSFLSMNVSCSSQSVPSIKSMYNVVKLINKSYDQEEIVALAFQYFSEIVKTLSSHESKTIIPVLLQSKACAHLVERCLENSSHKSLCHALTVTVWLAAQGQHYEADNYVTVNSYQVLNLMASCSTLWCLPVLQLLRLALQAMASKSTMVGACHFVKACRAFFATRLFSKLELQQIYGWLQQYVCQKDVFLREEAMSCIKAVLKAGPDLEQFITYHPWNMTMLFSCLCGAQCRLQNIDLDFCFLFSNRDTVQFWNSTLTNNFLMAVLNSTLTPRQQQQTSCLIDQIKYWQIQVDGSLMESVVSWLQN